MRALLLMFAIAAASCNVVEESGAQSVQGTPDLGAVASIGDTPKDMTAFVSSDCDTSEMADCMARDAQGRQYVFFDGALSRISIKKDEARPEVSLPAGMVFGEDIEASKEKASNLYRIKFDRGEVDGGTVYSSGFNIRSSSGVEYSLELIADERNKLKEVVQRTDF